MYLRQLAVCRLRRMREFKLSFTNPDGTTRMWTAIIGENGTAKTSLLQAVALTAAGSQHVNTLAAPVVGHLRDRRSEEPLSVQAEYEFTALGRSERDVHPLWPANKTLPADLGLTSEIQLNANETSVSGRSFYSSPTQDSLARMSGNLPDPLAKARARNLHLWFVAGYGVARVLPDAGVLPSLNQPSIERLQPLFDPRVALASTSFANYFDQQGKSLAFHRMLKKALLNVESLLPDIQDIELRGYGGVRVAGDLQERDRFLQRMGEDAIKIPAVALSHGYQSVIAWIADLVGHIVLEAQLTSELELQPADMQGLVLIDEIDLYLHPIWQATLVRALRLTFPAMQFIVTTHSPVVLAGLAPHEVVRLHADPDSGDIIEVTHDPDTGELVAASRVTEPGQVAEPSAWSDPRSMTASDLFRYYFGLEGITPNALGKEFRRYLVLARDPYRSDSEDIELGELRGRLEADGMRWLPEITDRRPR